MINQDVALRRPPSGAPAVRTRWSNTLLSDVLEAASGGTDRDVLARSKCLQALAALRHTKWFQVCVSSHTRANALLKKRESLPRGSEFTFERKFPSANELVHSRLYGLVLFTTFVRIFSPPPTRIYLLFTVLPYICIKYLFYDLTM